jgi:phage host-nuclease inhibitor protein Gam
VKLYELAAEYNRLCELAEDGEEVDAALVDLTDAIELKAERIGYVLRNLGANEAALDGEIDRLKARRDHITRQEERLRSYLRQCMEQTGVTRIKGPAFTITLSEGQPHVVIENVDALPTEYVRTKTEPNKAAILAAYKAHGECVPGARVERSTSLRIR